MKHIMAHMDAGGVPLTATDHCVTGKYLVIEFKVLLQEHLKVLKDLFTDEAPAFTGSLWSPQMVTVISMEV